MTDKLLPFNLEEALKNPERVVYRCGAKPLEWHWFKESSHTCQIYSVMSNGDTVSSTKEGFDYAGKTSPHDLMLLPIPEKTYWVNVYEVQGKIQLSVPFESEIKAFQERVLPLKLIKTISFTI